LHAGAPEEEDLVAGSGESEEIPQREGPVRLRRRSTIAFALVALLLLVASGAQAGGLVPVPVETGPRAQFGGTGNAEYFAWTQDRAGANGYDVWVDPTVGAKFQVNNSGTGYSNAVDQAGSLLAWQSVKKNKSDVKLYDMTAMSNVALPPGVNTSKWECCSGLFGNTFTFIRTTKNAFKLYLVTDLTTGDKINVTSIDRPKVDLASTPRIYGNWIVWTTSAAGGWKAYRYDIMNDVIEKIPNPLDKLYYAASVDLAGNVYLVRSGNGCAANVKLMKWTGSSNPVVVYEFDDVTDVAHTSIFDDGLGTVTWFVDFFDCSTFDADIYSFTNP
jgi:hypothetical protein